MIQTTQFDALAFELKHASDFEQYLSIPTEIDAEYDFGTYLYRVWYGTKCLGTFHRYQNGWLSEAFYNNPNRERPIFTTSDEAQASLVRCYQGVL